MATKQRAAKARARPSYRTSVSFPPELYQTLEQIAKQKRVSVAWVIRDAAEAYVSNQWPLLEQEGKGNG